MPAPSQLGDLYETAKWRRVRRAFLRLNPRCVAVLHDPGCDGRSTVVDHIVPRSRGGATWDRDNFQALSKPCHDAKTRREQAEVTAPVAVPSRPTRVVTGDYTSRAAH